MMQVTFALIKTTAMIEKQHLVIMDRILNEHFKVLYAHRCTLNHAEIMGLYHEHKDKPFFPDLMGSISGEVIKLVLGRDNAIARWREVMGPTDPAKADIRHLRYLFRGYECLADNGTHGSDSPASAEREIRIMLPPGSADAVLRWNSSLC